MNSVTPITVGRIVHFFHNGSDREDARLAAQNNAEIVPGIVTQTIDGLKVNLIVFANGSQPIIQAFSIDHKSQAEPGAQYWDYPVILEQKKSIANTEPAALTAKSESTEKVPVEKEKETTAPKKAAAKKAASKK